jgi:uncharacterized protein YlzI (FlbEa/FlbD family)
MKRTFRPITVKKGSELKKIFINVRLIEYIEPTPTAVYIKMHRGNGWLVENESIDSLLERLQSA